MGKEYGPGFVHIDCFYLPQLDSRKYYCFVAIDRATRWLFLEVYEKKNKENTTKRNRYTSAQEMKDDLARWRSFYNFHRRNRRIGRKTPYQMVCWWFQKQPDLFLKEPSLLLKYRSQPGET